MDMIYVAASSLDSRFTRICVASIRYFYPEIPVQVLAGGRLRRGLKEELQRCWDVGLADLPAGDYGWGFVKLEPLFRRGDSRFFVMDSDTVMTGQVLRFADAHAEDFIVNHEKPSAESAKGIYYDCGKAADEGQSVAHPAFLFNTGQWFGKSGMLSRTSFDGLIDWDFPRRLRNPGIFKNGEQGVFNYVVNEQCRAGKMQVARVPLMHWPGHGMAGLDAQTVAARMAAPLIVHWAGMKRLRLGDMVGADLLEFFEKQYYSRVPGGKLLRVWRACQDMLDRWLHLQKVRLILTWRYKILGFRSRSATAR